MGPQARRAAAGACSPFGLSLSKPSSGRFGRLEMKESPSTGSGRRGRLRPVPDRAPGEKVEPGWPATQRNRRPKKRTFLFTRNYAPPWSVERKENLRVAARSRGLCTVVPVRGRRRSARIGTGSVTFRAGRRRRARPAAGLTFVTIRAARGLCRTGASVTFVTFRFGAAPADRRGGRDLCDLPLRRGPCGPARRA